MSHVTDDIAKSLKKARENKGLSQRALSKKAGVPQSHISKIESGAVDLRVTSLIELARALDLELALVPRQTVPAVQSIIRTSAASTAPGNDAVSQVVKELATIQDTLAYLSKANQVTDEFAQLQRRIRDLYRFQFDNTALKSIRNMAKSLEALKGGPLAAETIRNLNAYFEGLRNNLAHASAIPLKLEFMRPAYSLDEEDDDA